MGKTQTKSNLSAEVTELGERLSAVNEELRHSLTREEAQKGNLTRLSEYSVRLEKDFDTTQTALIKVRVELVEANYKMGQMSSALQRQDVLINELETRLQVIQARGEGRADGIKEGLGEVFALIQES